MRNTEQGKKKPINTERHLSSFFEGILSSLMVSLIAVAVQIVSSGIALRTLSNIPPEFLFAILIALGLVIAIAIVVWSTKRQEQRRRSIIAKLRDNDRDFFQQVDGQIASFLREEVYQ